MGRLGERPENSAGRFGGKAEYMGPIREWFRRQLNDPQIVGLSLVLLLGFLVVVVFGHMLATVLASLMLVYLLEGTVNQLQRFGTPRLLSVTLVFLVFSAFLLLLLFTIMPLLSRQIAQLVEQLPNMISRGQASIELLPQKYPHLFSEDQVDALIGAVRRETISMGQRLLASFSFQSVVALFTLLIYLVLMPMLVFFFLKDKDRLLGWVRHYVLPRELGLTHKVWREVDRQIGNYIRGKFIEIGIVWLATYLAFLVMDLQFALLLAVLVGLSVIIPYIGAIVVTVPVVLIAYFQWGFNSTFVYLVIVYTVIQTLDGNVLVPVLFSEVVNLHPVAIIVAILIFGGVWGFWGVFFAIPLATLIQAVLHAWPTGGAEQSEPDSTP